MAGASAPGSISRSGRSGRGLSRHHRLGAILGVTKVVNSYPWPFRVIETYAKENGIPIPPGIEDRTGAAICMAAEKVVLCKDGLVYYTGFAIPVLICLAVGFAMSFIASRTRFGRYVYATGGNPEAAELSGINTRWLTVKVFMLMGVLVAISVIVTSARLDAATNSLGQLNEGLTSSRRWSSAARRLPAASAPSTAPCSAR